MSGLLGKTLKGFAWTAMGSWLRQAVLLGMMVVLARLLDPEDFGAVAYAGVFIVFMNTFVQMGFSDAIQQRPDLDAEYLDTAFWIQSAIAAVLVAGVWLASFALIFWARAGLTPFLLQALSMVLVASAFSTVQASYLRRQFKFGVTATCESISVICSGVVGVSCAYLDYGAWALVAQQLSQAIVLVPLLWLVGRWRPRARFSLVRAKALFGFGMNLVGTSLLTFVDTRFQDFVIGGILGTAALGFYTVAARLTQALNRLIVQVVSPVLFVTLASLQSDLPRMRGAMGRSARMLSAVTVPVLAAVAVLAPRLVPLVFGERWAAAAPLMQLMAGWAFFASVSIPVERAIVAVGRPNVVFRIRLFSAMSSLVMLPVAAWLGLTAVVIATLLRVSVMVPVMVYCAGRIIGFTLPYCVRSIRGPLIAGGAMVAAMLLAAPLLGSLSDLVYVIVLSVLGSVVYVPTALLLDREILVEGRRMVELVRKRRRGGGPAAAVEPIEPIESLDGMTEVDR